MLRHVFYYLVLLHCMVILTIKWMSSNEMVTVFYALNVFQSNISVHSQLI
jgi:hypothetical protein